MRPCQTVGLLLVLCTLSFIAGVRVGAARQAAPTAPAGGCETCAVASAKPTRATPPPAIPAGSGHPCLVEFGSDECTECQRMAKVMDAVEAQLKGKVDVVRVDTDLHPGEAQRWRLRLVPTQLFVDARGKELWRHEGALDAQELVARVRGESPASE